MPNTITIRDESTPSCPTPVNGWRVSYRILGSTGEYRIWPENFFSFPIIFTDLSDPDGTEYEGYVEGDCGDGFSPKSPWSTASSSGSESGAGPSDVGGCIDGEGQVVVYNNLPAGTVNDVTGIAGFDAFPPPLLPGPLSTRSGTHTAFTGIVAVSISGSGANGNAILWKNEVLVGCVNIFGAGLYSFPSETFEACDTILISMTDGDCD